MREIVKRVVVDGANPAIGCRCGQLALEGVPSVCPPEQRRKSCASKPRCLWLTKKDIQDGDTLTLYTDGTIELERKG
jgi:hypothetical protein